MIRAVIDTSVLVSALIGRRDTAPSRVLRAWIHGRFELVASPKLIGELASVVARDKLRGYVDAVEAAELIATLEANAIMHPDRPLARAISRDPNDDYLFGLAQADGAVLVSSDRDILDADTEGTGIRVMSAAAFLESL